MQYSGRKSFNKRFLTFWGSALLFLSLLFPSGVFAAQLIILLDSSNWMTEEVVDGNSKLDYAVEGLSGFLKKNRKIFDDIKIHFYDGESCEQSSKGKIPNKAGKRKALKAMGFPKAKVSEISSIGQALTGLKKGETEVFYINGSVACKKDLCTSFKEITVSKPNINYYIFGLAIPDLKAMEQLKCIASSAGGTYINVNKPSDFNKSLNKVEEKVAYNLEVKVFGAKGKEITEYMRSRYGYVWSAELYKYVNNKPELQDTTNTFPVRFKIPSGKYDVKIKYGNSERLLKNLAVKSGQRTERSVSVAKGSIVVKVFSGDEEIMGIKRLPKPKWWCEVFPAGSKETAEKTLTFPAEIDVFSGRYDLKIHYLGEEKWINNVEVKEDKTLRLEVKFPATQ